MWVWESRCGDSCFYNGFLDGLFRKTHVNKNGTGKNGTSGSNKKAMKEAYHTRKSGKNQDLHRSLFYILKFRFHISFLTCFPPFN